MPFIIIIISDSRRSCRTLLSQLRRFIALHRL